MYFKKSLAQSDYRHSRLRRMSLSNAIAPSVCLWLCLNVEGYNRGKWWLQLHLSLITPSFFSHQPFTVRTFCQCIIPRPQSGSAIYNGREPRSCLGRVFNIKLGSFDSKQLICMSQTQPLLELKTRPRFCPASWSLSMPQFVLRLRHCTNIVIPTLPQPKPTTIHQPSVSLRNALLKFPFTRNDGSCQLWTWNWSSLPWIKMVEDRGKTVLFTWQSYLGRGTFDTLI